MDMTNNIITIGVIILLMVPLWSFFFFKILFLFCFIFYFKYIIVFYILYLFLFPMSFICYGLLYFKNSNIIFVGIFDIFESFFLFKILDCFLTRKIYAFISQFHIDKTILILNSFRKCIHTLS